MRRWQWFLFLILPICFSEADAQITGSIEGFVRGPDRLPLAGVRVEVRRRETGESRTVLTDGRGFFAALQLPPGEYSLQARLAGFRTLVREPIAVAAGRALRVDLQMEIGPRSDEITVEAPAPRVSASVADWGGQISREDLSDLPVNGRDLFELAALKTGVSPAGTARRTTELGLGLHLAVKGARPRQNSFRIDGVYVNDVSSSAPAGAAGVLLGLESVAEINIVSDPYSAQFGRTAGAVFTAVTKTGSNEVHGSVYEYLRNDVLDARNFFDAPSEPIPPLRRNQFGGLISGPLQRNALFFMGNYEAIRQRRGRTHRLVVPNAQARDGILPDTAGGARFVPVAEEIRPYLDLYPLPNGADFGDGTGEFVAQTRPKLSEDFLNSRIDWLVSPALRFGGRYSFSAASSDDPDPLDVFFFDLTSQHHFAGLDMQWVRSPQTVANFRAAFSRIRTDQGIATGPKVTPEMSFVPGQLMGSIEVTGLAPLGGYQARLRPRFYVTNDSQLSADFVRVSGRHTWKAGAGFDRVQLNLNSPLSLGGGYNFTSLEDFLRARPRTGNVMAPGSDAVRGWRLNQFSWFVQDEIRLSSNLSLGLGVRYEFAGVPDEVNGKISTLREPRIDTEVTLGGPLYRNPSKRNFAPRVSLAWSPGGGGKTVIRAGAGIFYDLLGTQDLVIGGVRTPPYFVRLFQFRPTFPDIIEAVSGSRPSRSVDGIEWAVEQPYVVRWQAGIEREISPALALRAGYSGMRGIHLMGQLGNDNPTRPERLPDGRLYFPPDAPRVNPAFARVGVRRSQFNSFYHGFTLGLEGRWGAGLRFQSSYTFSHSIDEISHSVFGDFLNADLMPTMFDYRQNRGNSNFDLRHVWIAAASYRLPGPRNGWGRVLAAGWQLHALARVQSGPWFAPTVGFDRTRLLPSFGDLGQRPDYIGVPGRKLILGDPRQWFDPAAFALPGAGFYGNLGRGTLRGPGLASLDLAVHKLLWGNERHRVRFRAEVFNVTNHPNFQIPSARALFNRDGSRVGSAGRITETATTSRQIQLAVRWEF